MSKLPHLTRRQAEAAVGRAAESIALTSGAGCGKTLVLARRFTELLMRAAQTGGSPFERFVALTFTDKAALEMHARVRSVLLDALARSRDPDERRRLAEWITELPAAHISTIHSFCASLLRRHAVEAGVDPDFSVCADELVAAEMQAEAAGDAVLAAVQDRQAGALELLARADLSRVVGEVTQLMSRRIAWQETDYSDPDQALRRWHQRRDELRRHKLAALAPDAALREELDHLIAHPCGDDGDRLHAYRQEKLSVVRRILEAPSAATGGDFGALQQSPGNLGSRAAWGGKDTLVSYRRRLAAFVKKVAGLALWFEDLAEADAEAAGCLAALTQLAGDAIARHDRAKRRAGLLDFDDLIVRTARLVRENRAVRSSLRDRLGQLLVDECQDTDAHQLEMLWRVLTEGEEPPPGKLFIVGDLKQSIYRFRGAQVEVFTKLCQRFGKARIPLAESFRSHRAGVGFVNHVFSRLMGTEYEPIRSSRSELPPGASVEVLLAAVGDGGGAEAATIAQADLLAQRISEMIGVEKLIFDRAQGRWRPVRAGDVAILFSRMTASAEYERALRQRDVPYYVVAGTGFFRQQEVYDLLNALRAIDNPFDDVALLGVLRSAMFALDDNALLHIALAAEPPYFQKLDSAEVLGRLSAPQRGQLRFARQLLGRLHRSKDALGAAAVVERLLAETGYAATLLSQFQGRRKLGNVLRLLEAARSAQASGRIALADFVKRYSEFSIEQSRYEQAPVVGEADDVVRIMTIHKAKGLEFPVVVLPDLNAGRLGPRGALLFRHDWGITYKPPAAAEDDSDDRKDRPEPVSFGLAKDAERDELAAEDVRKLYVAVTRHQDHLILVGADWRKRDGGFEATGSPLAQLDEILGIAAALDAGRSEIAYGEGFSARVARIVPARPTAGRRRRPIGQRLLAQAPDAVALADGLIAAAKPKELALVGALQPAGEGGGGCPAGPIAATALADFAHCPMLYRWRHELRAPAPSPAGAGSSPASEALLDAATAGTIFHRCMEMLDFDVLASGDPGATAAHARGLVARALGEMELSLDTAGLAGELAEMLRRLGQHPLAKGLCAARTRLSEVSLLFRAGGLDVAGQIDLLYEDADGVWHVVDYKSDRVDAAGAEAHAARYELQVLIYLAAAGRHLAGRGAGCGRGSTPPARVADATLYFLRSGATRRFAADEQAASALNRRLGALAAELTRCRRTGQFPQRAGQLCPACPYAALCRPARQQGGPA